MSRAGNNYGQLMKIGAVERLTGVSAHTIRKWEERYGAVKPRRTDGGKRLYSDNDVQRLILIKRLADRGLSLTGLAKLSIEQLKVRWTTVATAEHTNARSEPVRVAILGAGIMASIAGDEDLCDSIEIVASAEREADLKAALDGNAFEVLLVERPAVLASTAEDIRRTMLDTGAAAAVVVYRFGTRSDVDALRCGNVDVLRVPSELAGLEKAITRLADYNSPRFSVTDRQNRAAPQHGAVVNPPRFSRESLATLATAQTEGQCGCHRNLVDIFLSLTALEDYLGGCENRSPEDERLHIDLRRMVGHSREVIEDAIEHFAEVEGIQLER
jgi:hypothetical protein